MIGCLEAATAAEPSRERSCRLLVLALCRTGHQAEALRAYMRLQQHLSQDFGVKPSPEVRKLHQAIINQDTTLLPSEGPESRDIGFTLQSDPELGLLFAPLALVQRQQDSTS